MKKFLGFGFMAALALSLTSCCCDRDNNCCDPCCPPKPRCCEPRPCCPQPCCPPKCEPRYFDNNNCCY